MRDSLKRCGSVLAYYFLNKHNYPKEIESVCEEMIKEIKQQHYKDEKNIIDSAKETLLDYQAKLWNYLQM